MSLNAYPNLFKKKVCNQLIKNLLITFTPLFLL